MNDIDIIKSALVEYKTTLRFYITHGHPVYEYSELVEMLNKTEELIKRLDGQDEYNRG